MSTHCGPMTILAALAAMISVVVGRAGAGTESSTARTRRIRAWPTLGHRSDS